MPRRINQHGNFVIATLILFLSSGCATPTLTDQQTHRLFAFTELNRSTDKPDHENEKNITVTFESLFGTHLRSNNIKNLSNDELVRLFKAIKEAAFYTVDARYTSYMQAAVEELQTRKIATSAHYSSLYRQHIKSRDFSEAQQLEPRLANLGRKLPVFIRETPTTTTVPAEWVIDAMGQSATLQNVDLSKDWLVVVVSHPKCHFSSRAALDISADLSLANLLVGRMKWITPQEDTFDAAEIAEWNNRNPLARTTIVHKRSAWPIENFTTTPYFYFLKNGQVIDKFEGWPKGGNKEKLIAALGRLGLSNR
jgi:hypothetical protein